MIDLNRGEKTGQKLRREVVNLLRREVVNLSVLSKQAPRLIFLELFPHEKFRIVYIWTNILVVDNQNNEVN